jgi:hypothetical protein
LDKAAQSFIADIHFAMIAQNLLDPAETAALPPPAQNVGADTFSATLLKQQGAKLIDEARGAASSP